MFSRLIVFIWTMGAASLLEAATITLGPVADTTLFQSTPDNNLGGEPTFICGTTVSGQSNRAVIMFNVAGLLPTDATIESVSLGVTVTKVPPGEVPSPFSLHRVLVAWGEGNGAGGNQGAPAVAGQATWLARSYPSGLWSAPGAAAPTDFATDASATETLDAAGSYTFNSTPNMIADVQNWMANPAQNFGWVLICGDELTAGSARRFGSREDPGNAPFLVITYSQPALPHVVLTPVADTSLFELTPDNNLGGSSLVAGSLGSAGSGERCRALMQFSTATIPPDVVLTSATLSLSVVRSPGGPDSTFDLHRLLRPWGEGGKAGARGDTATAGEATWRARSFPSTLWSASGAVAPVDFLPAVSSTTLVSGPAWYSFPNLLADVQFWLDHPGQNFGWILISESEGTLYTARRFGSREDPANAPSLVVEYLPRPHIDRHELSGNQFTLSFVAQAGQGYLVQSRDSLSTGTWTTLTNLPPLATTQTLVVTASATGPQRFYRVTTP